jgi:Tol biopolymer transport system component
MVLSPDGRYLAFLETDLVRPVPVGTPHIIDLKTYETKLLTQRPVLSMYWSPDGRKLALLTVGLNESGPSTKAPGLAAPLPQDVRFSWWAYETDSEALNSLVTVNPSAEFLQTIPYFDQYHLSMTIWSPDSRYLVVTSRQDDSEDGSVLVVDSAGQEDPRHIGEGKMAVWSWK